MALLEIALNSTLSIEGLLGKLQNDIGGLTKYGISQRQYPNEDIKNLTLMRAQFLYRRDFWIPLRAEELNHQPLANHVFDMCVNAGIGDAIRLLQKACIACGEPVTLDGNCGPETLATANRIPGPWLTDRYRVERIKHYLRRITVNPSQISFIKSWLTRGTA